MNMITPLIVIVSIVLFSTSSNAAKIGFASSHPEDEAIENFSPFLEYLNTELEVTNEIIIGTNETIRKDLLLGNIDLAFLSPLNYINLKTEDKNNEIRLIAKLSKNEQSFYGSNLIIHKDFSGKKLNLENFKLLYSSTSSTSSFLYPLSMLAEAGYDLSKLKHHQEVLGKYEIIKKINNGANFIAGMSDETLSAAMNKGVTTENIFRSRTSPLEIPFDAIVVRRNSTEKTKIEQAISNLIISEDNKYVLSNLPKIRDISGITTSKDEEYDAIRRRLAFTSSGIVLKFGLSLGLEPNTRHEKLAHFRHLKDFAFDNFQAYFEPQIYGSNDEPIMLQHLNSNIINVAEFQPLAAGEALSIGLSPVAIPIYNNRKYYESFFIKNEENPILRELSDIKGKTLAIGSAKSASSNVYPLKYLETVKLIQRKEYTSSSGYTADEIITLVASNLADAGSVAKFRLYNAKKNGHKFADKVKVFSDEKVQIPNGAFIIGPDLSSNERIVETLKEIIEKYSNSIGKRFNPNIGLSSAAEVATLKEHYLWANPISNKRNILLLIAIVVIILGGIMFLIIYQPQRVQKKEL